MGSTKEQSPSTGAKVRGALPGDAWRAYVSSGAEKAYDGPLKPGREEAAKLAHKGRLVAAHERERASYKIRVRGYDRKRRGEDPLAKAYTSRTVAVGPVKYASKKLQLRKPTKGEERAEQMRALLGGVGTVKLAAGAGAGALVTDAIRDAQNKSKKAANAVRNAVTKPEETKVTKSLEGRTLLGPIAPDVPRSLVEIRKDAEEVSKVFGAIGRLGASYFNAGRAGLASGGVQGAANNLRRVATHTGGMAGVNRAAAADLGQAASSTPGKVAAGVGVAGMGAWGAKKLAQRYAPAAAEPLKRQAKKYALYGAAGLGGTVAAGTAAGNALSPRR